MRQLFAVPAAYPIVTLFLLALLTLISATQLPKLQVEIAAQSLEIKNDPLWLDYQQLQQTFGSDQLVVIHVEDPALFTLPGLQSLQQLRSALEALDFVQGSNSLFSAPWVREEDDYIVNTPFLDPLPETAQALERVRKAATQNPLLSGQLISANAESMSINLQIQPPNSGNERGFDQRSSAAIEAVLQHYQPHYGYLVQIGPGYIRQLISERIRSDQMRILPAATLVLLVLLGLSLKSVNAAFLPLLTATISIVMTLAIMASLGVAISVMTSIVPVLLIIIGSTEDIHLLSEYQSRLKPGTPRNSAITELI